MAKFFFSIEKTLVVAAFLLFVTSCYAVEFKVVPVSEICKQSQNPSFCVSLLNSKLGATDLYSFGKYTINVVRANVTNTITLLQSLVAKGGPDPKLIAHYKNCLDNQFNSDGIVGDVDETEDAFKSIDYMGTNVHAAAIQSEVDSCISGVDPDSPSPHDPSLLSKYGREISQVADVILVISNLLGGAA